MCLGEGFVPLIRDLPLGYSGPLPLYPRDQVKGRGGALDKMR